jgi:hypothetical protein
MNRSLNDLLNRTVKPQTDDLALRVRKKRGHIVAVEFPSHTFKVLLEGYALQTVYADPSLAFGTYARPLVFTGNDVICTWDETLHRWTTDHYESTLRCVPTQTVNPPFTPLATSVPPLDTLTLTQPFNIDTNFKPLDIAMGSVIPLSLMPTLGTDEEVYSVSGTLSVSTGQLRLYNRSGVPWKLLLIYISVGTAPTGDNIIVDVLNSGSTIFTTPANRPTITAGSYTGVSALPPDLPIVAVGEYLTVDITSVGATVPGADLVTQFPMVR